MKKDKIIINGVEYPCRLTLGAIKEFKNKTGMEVTEIGNSVVSISELVYITIKRSCKKEQVVTPWQNEEELLDDLCPNDLPAMTFALFGDQTEIPETPEAKKNEVLK